MGSVKREQMNVKNQNTSDGMQSMVYYASETYPLQIATKFQFFLLDARFLSKHSSLDYRKTNRFQLEFQ